MYFEDMYKTTFSYGVSPIEVFTEKKLKYQTADLLNTLISVLSKEINHTIYGSSAYRFNEAEKDTPILLHRDFIEFLKYCLNINEDLAEEVKLFDKKLKLQASEDSVVKNDHVTLDTSHFRKEFMFDLLKSLLVSHKITEFLISSNNLHLAHGVQSYEVILPFDDKFFKTKIKNQSIQINGNFMNREVEPPKKFASMDFVVNKSFAISTGISAADSKILFLNLLNYYYDSELKLYAEKYKSHFLMIDSKGTIFDYSPVNYRNMQVAS